MANNTYVVYEVNSSRIVGININYHATERSAKSCRTRLVNSGKYTADDLAVAELDYYRKNIEKMIKRRNLLTGAEYEESINTPNCCSPASETYWSM